MLMNPYEAPVWGIILVIILLLYAAMNVTAALVIMNAETVWIARAAFVAMVAVPAAGLTALVLFVARCLFTRP